LEDPEGDLTQILLYHVLSGQVMAADVTDGLEAETLQGSTVSFTISDGVVMINGATIIATDIEASNGVIHVIDAVILPPADEADIDEADMDAEEADAEAELNIVETAIAAGNFETLVAAVSAAGLADALSGEGPFTVFAPTDEAFAALPEGTVEALLEDPEGDLTQILLYHVLSGQVMAADVTDGLEAETLQGSTVSFTISDGVVLINGATIIATDIETSNGVIHVIDAVILPPAE
jgi:transforming growth factor-beta-induced protein